MNSFSNWQLLNEKYLAAALSWLRLRLTWQIERLDAPAGEQSVLRQAQGATEAKIAQAAALMEAIVAEMELPPALVQLSQRFRLAPFEENLLLLCAAMEFDTGVAALCARAQDNATRPYPTFALALSLFEGAAWDGLSPQRPLRYWKLIEVNKLRDQPLTSSPMQADERIVNYIKGLNYLDERLVPLLDPLEVTEARISDSQQRHVNRIVQHVQQTAPTKGWPIVQLLGADQDSKQLVAWHAGNALGRHLYRLSAELLPSQPPDLEGVARLWQRETMLMRVALYLDAYEVEDNPTIDGPASPLNRFLTRSGGLIFLDSYDVRTRVKRATLELDVKKPTPKEQQAAWGEELAEIVPGAPALLAGQFNLALGTIKEISQTLSLSTQPDAYSTQRMLWNGCLARTRPRLDKLAQRIEPKATWGDIVLRPDAFNLLRQITDQVKQRTTVYDKWGFRQRMNRGLGILTLFAGKSGTGKTMAAEVLANDLHLNLYRIDLSAVVNKYIGETEKNLRRLFDAAEDGGAVLFFDEADALFGSRSQVRDSHDRYANIEVNYLLQRIESYQGLAILATNMKSALDEAFTRRLRFVIDFPVPDQDDRKRIWQRIFPPEMPLDELDYDRLAGFKLAGGNISNVAINAAFQAARLKRNVTMPYVLNAIRAELIKLERLVDDADFW